MCYSFDDNVVQVNILQTKDEYRTRKQPAPTNLLSSQKDGGSSGSKRAASETLEQNVTKVAKLSTGKDYGIKSETEVKEEPDPRDEKIALLEKKLKTLAKELEVMTNDRDEHRLRVCELEARETKRIEKEKLVETDMHSTMKLAGKKLEAQLKANALNEKKEFKAKCLARVDKANEEKETAIADLKAKHAEQTKRTVDGWKKKLQDSEERRKQDNADHKQEVKDLKEKHKEDIKSYKPDHSIAMKEKAKELRAKDKKIADLEQATKGIDALNAEKESLATKLEKQRDKTEKLQDLLDRLHQAKVDMEGAYNHKLEHEARRWKIQNDIAEGSKAKLMIQQRSNFALREECNVKNNRIQALQQQLHAPQRHNYISTEDTAVQSYIFTTDAAVQSHISTTDAAVQKSSDVSKSNRTLDTNDIAKALGLNTASVSTPSGMSTPLSEYIETVDGLERVE